MTIPPPYDRPRFHLLGLEAGDRFAIEPGPDAPAYTMIEAPIRDADGNEKVVLKALGQDGVSMHPIEISIKNGNSYFVYPVPRERTNGAV